MKVHVLETEQLVRRPREEVFAFFDRAENLARITPARMRFQVLTPAPIRMREGAVIDYVLQPLGFPLRWRTLITAYEPPERFVDEQIQGPYSFWHHTHTFAAVPEGTLVGDRVLWALPLQPLGELAAPLVKRRLDAVFDHRRRIIERLFDGPARGGDEDTP